MNKQAQLDGPTPALKGDSMKTYVLEFHGCLKGAIGRRYTCHRTVEASDLEGARLALYETHDHIMLVKVVSIDGEPAGEAQP